VTRMPFGRYRGWGVAELPDDYLSWLLTLPDLREPLAAAIRREAERRGVTEFHAPDPEPVPVAVAEEVIGAGVRSLARKYHPDVGGSHAQMVAVNEAAASLRRLLRGLS
jgi:hypothetical protein